MKLYEITLCSTDGSEHVIYLDADTGKDVDRFVELRQLYMADGDVMVFTKGIQMQKQDFAGYQYREIDEPHATTPQGETMTNEAPITKWNELPEINQPYSTLKGSHYNVIEFTALNTYADLTRIRVEQRWAVPQHEIEAIRLWLTDRLGQPYHQKVTDETPNREALDTWIREHSENPIR